MQNQQNKQRIKQWDWRSVQDSKISEENSQSTETLQEKKKRSSAEEIYDQIK